MSQITAVATLNTKSLSQGSTQLIFAADYKDEANKDWAAFTPNLQLNMHVKPSVADKFDLGKTYLLTFEERA